MDLLAPWLQVLFIILKYSAITDLHIGPLQVTQLKHRNYNSLTKSHTPSITHEWSLLITLWVFTGLLWTSRGCLLPRTELNWESLSLSHIATDGQSVSLSWYRAPSGVHDQILVTFWQFLFCPWGWRSLWREDGSVFCQSLSAVISQLSVCTVIYI
jgi:hypothetical protein